MDTRHNLKLRTFLNMAVELAYLSTCTRRNVGCILLNADYKIVGSGYNGSPKHMTHCIDKPCAGSQFKTGEGLMTCQAIHAEQNALMQCADITSIAYAVCTTFPCVHCLKMLANTGCHTIVFVSEYPCVVSDEMSSRFNVVKL